MERRSTTSRTFRVPYRTTLAIASFAFALVVVKALLLTNEGASPRFASDQANAPTHIEISPELIELRRHATTSPINVLAYQDMKAIFYNAPVNKTASTWKLERADAPLLFNYEFDGQTFTPDEFLDRTHTNALLIIKHDRIVYEKYRNFSTAGTQFLSMSIAKSITSMLIGAAIADGHIASVDDQISSYVPELSGTGYDGVTIRDALLMRSGIDLVESYATDPPSEFAKWMELSMISNKHRVVDQALGLKRGSEPGTEFNYLTINAAVLGWVLSNAVGQPVADYMRERLWAPLGAERGAYWLLDGPPGIGRENTGMGFNATLRDYGRLGLMMLHEGKANGKQILPTQWVEESTTPRGTEPAKPGASASSGYQYLWWTLPDSNAYYASGYQGQFIYIDPDTETVIVKMSYSMTNVAKLKSECLAFFKAASAWNR